MNGRLTRVFLTSTNECIGTTARIRQDGLCVSARHGFVNGGAFLEAKGWDSQLQFVASSPRDDIIVLQGEARVNKNSFLLVSCSSLGCATVHIWSAAAWTTIVEKQGLLLVCRSTW